MAITTDNQTYFDDLNVTDANGLTPIDKNYLRILFKPGYAVQTRELNQLQSLIQSQLEKVGESIFRSGKPVIDGIARFDSSSEIYSIDVNTVVSDAYTNIETTDNLKAKIVKVVPKDGGLSTRLYVKSINAIQLDSDASTNVFKITSGETVSISDESASVATLSASVSAVNKAVGAHIAKGVYFIKGCYPIVDEQYGVYDLAETASTFTGYVILNIVEGYVDVTDDSTLVDNAGGSYNYNAPGADRYFINLTLQLVENEPEDASSYIRLLKVVNDQVILDNSLVSLNGLDDKLAQRTYEESGNYEVNPFPLHIREAYNDGTVDSDGMYTDADLPDGYTAADAQEDLIAKLDPSVAYVNGYRVELKGSLPLKVNKARTTYKDKVGTSKASSITAEMGSYVNANISLALLSPYTQIIPIENVGLRYAIKRSSSIIGYTKIKSVELDNITSPNYACKVFLYDIEMTNGNAIATNDVIITNPATLIDNDVKFTVTSALKDTSNTLSLYTLPVTPIKTVGDTLIQRKIRRTSGVTGSSVKKITFTLDATDSIDKSTSNMCVKGNGGGPTGSDIPRVFLPGTDYTIDSGTPANVLSITLNGTAALHESCDVLMSVTSKAAAGKKTLKTEDVNVTFIPDASDNYTYELDNVYHLVSVNDQPGHTVLSDGQNDSSYVKATVILDANDITSINVTHYEISTIGDYYDANSYFEEVTIGEVNVSRPMNLEDIPYYKGIPLHSVLDFRYVLSSDSVTFAPLDPGSAITFNADYYLPRVDTICVNANGNFSVVEGIAASVPQKPSTPSNSMEMYVLNVGAYTFGSDDVIVEKIDNQRYTMSNIRALDKRISNLEYYTTLSMLEKSAKDTVILDETDVDRFKNGFVVDNFSGHNVGDPTNEEYNCAVDPEKNELRPAFSLTSLKLTPTETASVAVHDRAITLPYTSTPYISQTYGSDHVSVNPYSVATYVGKLNLYPSKDHWCDTKQRPDLVVKDNALKDAIRSLTNNLEGTLASDGYDLQVLGTEWGSWETYWSGKQKWKLSDRANKAFSKTPKYRYESSQDVDKARNKIKNGGDTTNIDLGDRVIDVTVRPYIRQRYVYFSANALKPNTVYYPYFDGKDVSAYCHKKTASTIDKKNDIASINGGPVPVQQVSVGSQILKTDANGNLYGLFIIPNPKNSNLKFLTGTREFRLTDSKKNIASETTSYASANYVASGVRKKVQSTVLSTGVDENIREKVKPVSLGVATRTEERSGTCWIDPVAQSFLISNPEGIFATSIDLYFAKKPASGTAPVEIFIVTCENGIPTQNVVPLSTVTKPIDEVNAAINGATATNFQFEQPVYLTPGQEYAIVCVSVSSDYRVFTATLGAKDTVSGKIISSNPYNGVFFKSQNSSTWTPDQSKDLKFKLNRAVFAVGTTTASFETSGVCKVDHIKITNGGSGYTGQPTVTITGGSPTTSAAADIAASPVEIVDDAITAINLTNQGAGYTSRPTVTITSGGGADATAEAVMITQPVSAFILDQDSIELSTATGDATVSNVVTVLRKEYVAEPNVTYTSSLAKYAWGSTEIGATVNLNQRATVVTTMSTSSDYISPVVDTDRLNMKLIQNCILTDSSKSSKYVTREIQLAQNADQLDIYFDINRPSTACTVNVYGSFDDGDWTAIPMVTAGAIPVNSDPDTFSEVHYKLNTAADVTFTKFKVKIEFIGSNIVDVPRIKNFRAIATW